MSKKPIKKIEMNNIFHLRSSIALFGIPILIIVSMILISKSQIFVSNPSTLSIGIIVDLLFTTPIVYFLLIRKTKIPKTTTLPILLIGLIVATFIIPSENQYYLALFKTWAFPLIELMVISYVIYNIRKTIKKYKTKAKISFDFYTSLKETCAEILPKKVVIPVVTEIAVFYYSFILWKKKKPNKNEFTYHKDSGTITLLVALLFIVGVETIALHLLLVTWNAFITWGLTFLSIYSGIQIFGFLRSLSKRFISIENNTLKLRYGILSESTIDLNNIKSIAILFKDIELNDKTRTLSPLGELDSYNIVLRLKKENTLSGLYGTKKKFKTLVFFIDDKEVFKQQIESYIQKE